MLNISEGGEHSACRSKQTTTGKYLFDESVSGFRTTSCGKIRQHTFFFGQTPGKDAHSQARASMLVSTADSTTMINGGPWEGEKTREAIKKRAGRRVHVQDEGGMETADVECEEPSIERISASSV